MTTARKRAESRIDPELATRILKKVPIPEAFLFFTDIGEYTGEFAPCLTDFCEKLKKVPLGSIEFHFKRGDFETWIGETLGDRHLAGRISEIDRSTKGEKLRETIRGMSERRLDEARRLRKMHLVK